METISLNIPNMKSPHCQMTVANAVKSLGGNVKTIAPGNAVIDLNGVSKAAIVQAIQKAGYNVVN